MARDNLKEIIERGKQIPTHGSAVTTLTKEKIEKAKKVTIDKPKHSQTVRAIRSNTVIRK